MDAVNGYRHSLPVAAFLANYAPQGGRICRKCTSSRRGRRDGRPLHPVKPNGDGRRDEASGEKGVVLEKGILNVTGKLFQAVISGLIAGV
ncbi:hypothetical protein [Bacteroides sp. An19]|uniref:hypothetical protein n=1 Tax=Bacteroides sp. An19 TaxID=1965580 RepID=UPI0013A655B7|nr:hypothetical protein [Bacteroides sp. An19]